LYTAGSSYAMAGKESLPIPSIRYVKISKTNFLSGINCIHLQIYSIIFRNVVAQVYLGVDIDLKKLHKDLLAAGHKDAKYGTSFTEMVSIYLPRSSVLGKIFATGKITCMGANSVDKAKLATRQFARLVQTHGYQVNTTIPLLITWFLIDVYRIILHYRRRPAFNNLRL